MALINVTDDSFEADVLQKSGVVLVDFWATWCGPCRQIAPTLQAISDEMGDKITIAKVDVEENPMTPGKFGVSGIPTLILFKDGEMIGTKTGNRPKADLVEWIESQTASA